MVLPMTDRIHIPSASAPRSAGIEALRERAAGVLERALGFVEAQGNALARLRARILVELEPVALGLEALAQHQRESGQVARLGQVLPAQLDLPLRDWDREDEILGTLEALSVLADWGRLYEAVTDRLVDVLLVQQARDGSFGPVRLDASASEWRVVTTALSAGFLGRTRSARPEMLLSAGAYLANHWSVDHIRRHGWPSVAAFAHYFTNVDDDEGEAALPWCARELERGHLAHEFGAADVMRVLFYCEASSLPGVSFDAEALLDQMFDDQREDGSIGGPDHAPVDCVASTLDAMHFSLRICRSRGQ